MTSTSSSSIPYYPTFITEQRGGVLIWWFEKDFSQIGYGPQAPERGRNACVLITLLTAAKIAQRNVAMEPKLNGPPFPRVGLVTCVAESILEGCEVYGRLMDEKKLVASNLNVPEAYMALRKRITHIHEWKSYLYVVPMAKNLANFLQEGLHAWNYKSLAKKSYLFVVLIAAARAVLIVFDQVSNSMTFVDSHPHALNHGAIIAQTSLQNVKEMCKFINEIYKEADPDCFEVSYFQLRHRWSKIKRWTFENYYWLRNKI